MLRMLSWFQLILLSCFVNGSFTHWSYPQRKSMDLLIGRNLPLLTLRTALNVRVPDQQKHQYMFSCHKHISFTKAATLSEKIHSANRHTTLRFVTGDYTVRNVTSPFGHFYLGWTILIDLSPCESVRKLSANENLVFYSKLGYVVYFLQECKLHLNKQSSLVKYIGISWTSREISCSLMLR